MRRTFHPTSTEVPGQAAMLLPAIRPHAESVGIKEFKCKSACMQRQPGLTRGRTPTQRDRISSASRVVTAAMFSSSVAIPSLGLAAHTRSEGPPAGEMAGGWARVAWRHNTGKQTASCDEPGGRRPVYMCAGLV